MSNQLAALLVPSLVALLIAVAGIFQGSIRRWLIGPRLKVQFEMSEPFVGAAAIGESKGGPPEIGFFFRIGVTNWGKSAAARVSVLLTLIEKYNDSAHRYEVEEWFVPIGLDWCHGIGSELQALNPQTTIYFDLGHCELIDNAKRFAGDLDAPQAKQFVLKTSRINARESGYVLRGGTQYQLRVQVSAANSGPIEAWLHIQYRPGWSNDVRGLMQQGHTRVALLGQRPQSILGAVEEHFRREMTNDSYQ
jgi:hypothetical protein